MVILSQRCSVPASLFLPLRFPALPSGCSFWQRRRTRKRKKESTDAGLVSAGQVSSSGQSYERLSFTRLLFPDIYAWIVHLMCLGQPSESLPPSKVPTFLPISFPRTAETQSFQNRKSQDSRKGEPDPPAVSLSPSWVPMAQGSTFSTPYPFAFTCRSPAHANVGPTELNPRFITSVRRTRHSPFKRTPNLTRTPC